MSSFLLSNAEGKNGYNDDVGVCFVGGIDLGWDLVKHGLAVPDTRYFAEGQGALSSGDSSDRNLQFTNPRRAKAGRDAHRRPDSAVWVCGYVTAGPSQDVVSQPGYR